MQVEQRYSEARKITLIGAGKNGFLATIKIIFGYFGFSHALMADGVHSLADLLVDTLVIVAAKVGSKNADIDHPYGHQRIETAATVGLAALLILAAAGIMFDAGEHLLRNGLVVAPKFYVLVIALISIAANELLYRFTYKIANQTKSQLLRANAWHHRSDAASSVVVVIGVAGALIGYKFLDAAAAIIVALMIIKMGYSLAYNCVRELVDTAPDAEIVAEIHAAIVKVPGVHMVHQLRTRMMGDNIFVDVHVLVEPDLSVSEGHYIATKVHHSLIEEVANVTDVTVHIDPENDEIAAPNIKLPSREQIIEELKRHWQTCLPADAICKISLHYLSGKIIVEVYLSLTQFSPDVNLPEIEKCLQAETKNLPYIENVRVWMRY